MTHFMTVRCRREKYAKLFQIRCSAFLIMARYKTLNGDEMNGLLDDFKSRAAT